MTSKPLSLATTSILEQPPRVSPPPDLLETALAWLATGRPIAMATVTSTRGSSPRPVGSFLVVNPQGDFIGSVSGGCVEAAVIEACSEALATNSPRVLEFSVSRESVWEVGLACGGSIEVFVNPHVDPDALSSLAAAIPQREVRVLATDLSSGMQRLLDPEDSEWTSKQRRALAAGECVQLRVGTSATFLQPFLPRPRLVIIGAVRIAESLSAMAALAEYDVWLIDPRRRFVDRDRFPQARRVDGWPDSALAQFGLDNRTAVVALTHDPKLDDPALLLALRSPAFYVAALGSRRTQAARLLRLRQAGLTEAELKRLNGPAGLDIGATSPAEIAISILAELTCIRRNHIGYESGSSVE